MAETDPSLDALADAAARRALGLIAEARHHLTRGERRDRRRVAGLLADPDALVATVALTDEVMRYPDVADAARALRATARGARARGFGAANAALLRAAGPASAGAPGAVVGLVRRRLRAATSRLIVDSGGRRLGAHLARRRADGLTPIVNALGEAVLGEREAADRLGRVLEAIARPDVDEVSVKLSSVVSPLVTLDHAGSVDRVAARLREVYRAAREHRVRVTLDMEEFRDLRLTLDAFTTVLGEPEFAGLAAGVVLQAYLPESHAALERLGQWATDRAARGGAPAKVRLVKGANLAMEHAEAQLHGWTAAPYATKAEVDASYARLLDAALSPRTADALRVGVASHNLFCVAWALEVATARGIAHCVDVEMLEGMANGEARALAASGVPVLLYTPVTRADDFVAAVSYLVRRLDENTAPENYLAAALDLAGDPARSDEQRARFAASLAGRHAVSTASRRHAGFAASLVASRDEFANVPDGDPTDDAYVSEVAGSIGHVTGLRGVTVGPPGRDHEVGVDPSDHGAPWYRYAVADAPGVDAAVARARAAAPGWESRGAGERARVLRAAADAMQRRRAMAVAVMARDAGKTVAEADPEVSEAVDYARYYAQRAADLAGSAPLGVVAVAPPWNFPYAIPAGGVAAALAAGNAVILKPAPEAVAVAAELVAHFTRRGCPATSCSSWRPATTTSGGASSRTRASTPWCSPAASTPPGSSARGGPT